MAARKPRPVPMGPALDASDAELDALTTPEAMQALAAQAVDGGPADALDAYVRAEPEPGEDGDATRS